MTVAKRRDSVTAVGNGRVEGHRDQLREQRIKEVVALLKAGKKERPR